MSVEVIELAGRTYNIRSLSLKKNREWRKNFQAPFEELIAVLQGAGKIELTDGNSLASIINVAKSILLNGFDILTEALFAYSPELAADKDFIEENATPEEALDALIKVLKQAYPLGKLRSLLPDSGPPAQPTLTNLASPNGAVTATALTK